MSRYRIAFLRRHFGSCRWKRFLRRSLAVAGLGVLAGVGAMEIYIARTPLPEVGRIRCQRFLGGLLRHYYRAAA